MHRLGLASIVRNTSNRFGLSLLVVALIVASLPGATAAAPRTQLNASSTRFTVSAIVDPVQAQPGEFVTVKVTVKNEGAATRGSIQLNVHDPNAKRVRSKSWLRQQFSAGQTRTFTDTFALKANAPQGTYSVGVVVKNHYSNGKVTTFEVQASAPETAALEIVEQPAPTPTPEPIIEQPEPKPEPVLEEIPETCLAPHLRRVKVSSTHELFTAIAAATPGDLIYLADGTYSGEVKITRSGTAENRITMCGSRNAVLNGGNVAVGYGIYLNANFWTLQGFTVTNYMKGVQSDRANHNILTDLHLYNFGQEAVHFRGFSSDNVISHSWIRDTGKTFHEYGEGVYLGSWNGHWSKYSGGLPDASDRNHVLNNVFGPNITAENIDAKEGTTGGVISGNTFDGSGMTNDVHWIDSWVELAGNSYTVMNNHGINSKAHGFQVIVQLPGWGTNNDFSNNTGQVNSTGTYAYGIAIEGPGNAVACNNIITGAASGMTNISCY